MIPFSPAQTPVVAAVERSAACDLASYGTAVLIVRVTNFFHLRREAGRVATEALGEIVAARIKALLAADRVTIVAQDTVETMVKGVTVDDAATAQAAVKQAFQAPEMIGDVMRSMEIALGSAFLVGSTDGELQVVEEAEAALADAILSGVPELRVVGRDEEIISRDSLSHDLVTAIRNGELLLHYQPKLHLRRREIVGVEALLRWQHPSRGLIYPGDFIPLAEQTGDIAAMTLWAIRRVLVDQQRLDEQGHALTVFVNIAGILLTDQDFVERACSLIRNGGRPLGFEITETSVIQDARTAIANLYAFHAIGIAIAIDDYGTGLSSLTYLKQLPACELKIDKLFVTKLSSSHRDPLIVRSTIDLAHALEMKVVAEGVEDHATLALLTVMGCDMAQGFLISHPLDLNCLIVFLNEHATRWIDRVVSSPIAIFPKRASDVKG